MAKSPRTSQRVKLKPQNPFDLIRMLARSQSDPRKAVAELVQNSLDAGAREIDITWFNDKGIRALRIWDNGAGVFPELPREDALLRIARTIGHSYKLDLTPAQRREQMVLGKYGIGLIGFWSVGSVLELKSRVGGGRAFVLRLREDESQGEVFASRARLIDEADTFTEITIRDVHAGAVGKIRPPRLQAYLANELRGQLLERQSVVHIHDRIARGLAKKAFRVEPRPYLGRPIDDLRELEVPGFESARLELYLVAPEEERRGTVSLSCGGTLVLDDMTEIDGADAPRSPWDSGRLEGVIDFPDLSVAPSTRRGFVHDEPVAALLAALEGLERELRARLDVDRRRRDEQQRESLARDIRRAFLSVARMLPEYDLLAVRGRAQGGSAARESSEPRESSHRSTDARAGRETGEGEPLERDALAAEREASPEVLADEAPPEEEGMLFPPGPLDSVRIQPRKLRVPRLASRTLHARALDAGGRRPSGAIEFVWTLDRAGELEGDGADAVYTAPDQGPGDGGEIRIRVTAVQGDVRVADEAKIALADAAGFDASVGGIPEPEPVSAAGETWRSRVRDGRWQYNAAHRDYQAVVDNDARRLRYLIHLFAKEVVLKNFGAPGHGDVLERMVEVLTHLDAKGR